MASLINWYPGHIAKAQNTLKEQLKLIDFVLELVDARLPSSSRFDVTKQLLGDKPRVLVFTKGDLADPNHLKAWMQFYRAQGFALASLNAQTGQGLPGLQKQLEAQSERVTAKMIARGRRPRPSRVMVVGLPNVGKSSLINKLAKKKRVDVGNKPGITKGVRWIRLGTSIEMMDTPGIIPPKLDNQALALKLAMIGSVSTEAYDPILIVPEVIKVLQHYAPGTLALYEDPTLEGIARQRKAIRPGGELDLERTARTFMNDLRTGALGALTLDGRPNEAVPDVDTALQAVEELPVEETYDADEL